MSTSGKKLDIAFLVDDFPQESKRYIVHQVTGLLERGHDVTIYSTNKPDEDDLATTQYDLIDRTVYTPIPTDRKQRVLQSPCLFFKGLRQSPVKAVKSCNPIQFGLDALSLRPLYRAVPMLGESFDIVHAHFGPKGRIAAILKQIGIFENLVLTFHGFGVRRARENSARYSKIFSIGDRFLANSRYTYQELLDFGVTEDKLTLHYNCIDVERFQFRWSRQVDTLPEPIKLITVARLEDIKGIEYSLQAVAQLQENHDEDFAYHIVGDGSKRSALESLAVDLDITSSVTFHGHIHKSEVQNLLSDSHIFILPSVEEAFGMVLVEAQAVGLPIIASNVGGIPEAVNEGVNAKLVPPEDSQAIVTAMIEWIDCFEEWPEIGLEGRKYTKIEFGKDKMLNKLVKIYNEVYQ